MAATATTTTTNLRLVLDDLAEVVGRIQPQQLGHPTPCDQFDVERLRRHVLFWLTDFAAGFATPDGHCPRSSESDDYVAPGDPAAAIRQAAGELITALAAGAGERPLVIGSAAMPGAAAVGMILWEYQMHGWDLARAIGRPWSPPVAAAEESLAFAPNMLSDEYQGEGKAFAPQVPVPGDAPAFDRLLGLSGRDPNWRPPSPDPR